MVGKHSIEPGRVRDYLLAGKALVTVQSVKGSHLTYRVVAADDGLAHFVSVLSGDNSGSYRYVGMIGRDGQFRATKKSPAETSPSFQGFAWLWSRVSRQERDGQGRLVEKTPARETQYLAGLAARASVFHHGHCARCGRLITNPGSLESGIGPECRRRAARAVMQVAA